MKTRNPWSFAAVSMLVLAGCAAAQNMPVSSDSAGRSGGATGSGTGGSKSGGSTGTGGAANSGTGGTAGGQTPAGTGGAMGGAGAGAPGGSSGSSGGAPGGGASGGATGTGSDAGGGPGPQPPGMALETVQVPASGDAVGFKTSLAMGELYLLKATGVVDLGGQKLDAEFSLGATPAETMGDVDVGVDIGVKQVHQGYHTTPATMGPDRAKWFPHTAPREDHTYYLTVTGEGKALSLKLTKPAGAGAGSGAIDVSLIALSPAPPKVGAELETVMLPVRPAVMDKPELTSMTTQLGKIYLLQAAGFGKVGGGGTGQGDADYMDWDVNGTKKNEGESGADFGVGVDETMVLHLKPMGGSSYKPRQRWWGLWRMDHTYYLLFEGTGKPIELLYFDSGYTDNSPTDKLTVKVFAAP